MEVKFFKRRLAFTLSEIVIVVTILGISAAMITLSSQVGKQTARGETEKLAAKIESVMKTADRTHKNFTIDKNRKGYLRYIWDGKDRTDAKNFKTLSIDYGRFSVSLNVEKINYSGIKNDFTGTTGELTITSKEDATDYSFIEFSVEGGRMRIKD